VTFLIDDQLSLYHERGSVAAWTMFELNCKFTDDITLYYLLYL